MAPTPVDFVGIFRLIDDVTPATGTVTVTPNTRVLDIAGHTLLEPKAQRSSLANGVMVPVPVIASDSTGISPSSGLFYRVAVDLDGVAKRTDNFVVTIAGSPINGATGRHEFSIPDNTPAGTVPPLVFPPAPPGGGHTIADEGVALTNRATLNFVGSAVTAVDNSGAGRTDVTITGGGGSLTVQDEGVPLATAADTLNFTGAGVTASGAGAAKTVNVPGGAVSSVNTRTGAVSGLAEQTSLDTEVTNRTNADALAALKANNLSDVANAGTSRTNLGLGTAATQNKVAAGSAGVLDATDATTTNARTPTAHAHPESDVTSLTTDLAAKAADSAVVHNTGAENVAGVKTFTAKPVVPAGTWVNADIDAAAAIAESKLNLATDAAAGTGSRRTLGTSATSATAGNDARLSDARTPTAHASTHNSGGSDALAADSAAATPSLRSLGTTATKACAGNDSRLSDTRTPTDATVTPAKMASPVALTDAATIATDASLGSVFTVTLGGNRTLGAPTNPTNGQKLVWRIRQDGTGARTLAYNAVFRFGTDVASPTLSTAANKTDYIGAIYNGTDSTWDVVAVSRGY